VLNDPALGKHAGRFAWLSINGELSGNARFVDEMDVDAYPTFLVLDGANGRLVLRYAGSLTTQQFEQLLNDGERAVRASNASPAAAALARADRLDALGKTADAAAAYEHALAMAPATGADRGRPLNSLLAALKKKGDFEQCAAVAGRETPSLEPGPAFAAAAAAGLDCATGAPESLAWREPAIRTLEPLVMESLSLDKVLADDRSSAYAMLVDLRKARGDTAGAREMAGRWMTFLENQAAAATSVEARAAFDAHRVAAALALGDPARAVPALLDSERDLPDDYNPPARLAILYLELGRFDAALAESTRALDRAYGARKLHIFDNRADIYAKMGDKAAARRTLDEALAYADSLPRSQRPRSFMANLRMKAAGIAASGGWGAAQLPRGAAPL
jgi:tetratricopeptide (TPR) repeat protein